MGTVARHRWVGPMILQPRNSRSIRTRHSMPSGCRSALSAARIFVIASAPMIYFTTASAQQGAPTCTVSMTPSTVKPDQEYLLEWSSTNATEITSTTEYDGRAAGTNPLPLKGSTKATHDRVGTIVITLTPAGRGGAGSPCSATLRVVR
jgi:hypothetical protein